MKQTPFILLAAVVLVVAAFMPAIAWGDAAADLRLVMEELRKDSTEQDSAMIDQKLTAIVAVPGELSAGQYQQARTIQDQRRVDAMEDKTAPQKRLLLNQAREEIIAEIGRLYLPNEEVEPNRRIAAYTAQFLTSYRITNSIQTNKVQAKIAKIMLADLDSRYLGDEEIPVEVKESTLRSAVRPVRYYMRSREKRYEVYLGLYGRIIALDTPTSKSAYVDRALTKAAQGKIDAALADFTDLFADAKASGDVKNLAKYERMRLLTGQERWNDAKPDATALSQLIVKDASGRTFSPSVAATSKHRALQVRLATADLNQAEYVAEIDKYFLEVLSAGNLSAEEKSSLVATVCIERAVDAAGHYQWDQSLRWAKAAYDIAPNRRVRETASLIQKILANKSRGAMSIRKFDATRNPQDLAAAVAFYARQSGTKTVLVPADEGEGTVEKIVTLLADLSNQDQFPKQLASIATPLAGTPKTSVEGFAANHTDPLTRALACGLLGKSDDAIEIMADAINGIGLESPDLSGHVNFTARFVRAKFESVALANAFLQSQVDGPAGKDGEVGTEDDTPNPLSAVEE